MSDKQKALLALMIIVFIFSTIFLYAGIFKDKTDEEIYTYPIYISDEFTLNGYAVSGSIKNRSNETIQIDNIIIQISGIKGNTRWIGSYEFYDINLSANEEYYLNDIKDFSPVVKCDVNSVTCTISGEKFALKYSPNGVEFGYTKEKIKTIVLSSIFFVSSSVIILYIIIKTILEHKKYKKEIYNKYIAQKTIKEYDE